MDKQQEMDSMIPAQLRAWAGAVPKPDASAVKECRRRMDAIAKPLDGLGLFEEMIARMAGMQRTAQVGIAKAKLPVFCADNGIVEEGVAQSDASVTAAVALSLGRGTSSVCRMAKEAGIDVLPVDIGMQKAVPEEKGVRNCNIRRGTGNFLKGKAMTEEEAVAAIRCGLELAEECAAEGAQLLLTGEMGIGNTTTSAAMAAALLHLPVETVTGRGAGLTDAGLQRKRDVIRLGLQLHGFERGDETVEAAEVFRLLCSVGGLDIAGMAGVFLGGALCDTPVVIDGVISAVAALTAERLFPGCRAYMLASHQGKEPAMPVLLARLGLRAPVHAALALGEGTGGVMLVPLLRMALAVYHGDTGFDALGMVPYERYGK